MDIKAISTIAHTGVIPDFITDALTEACHVINTQVLIHIDATHHTEGHHHIELPPFTPETTADLDHILYINPVEQHVINLNPVLTKQHQNIRIGDLKESPVMTPSLTTTVQMMHPVILMMI